MYRITTSTHVTEYHYTVGDFRERLNIQEDYEDLAGATLTVAPDGMTITLARTVRETGTGPSGSWSA
jgi:hypothetical protein